MERKPIQPMRKSGPLFESDRFREMKDPCIVHDGSLWHIYGTGVTGIGPGFQVVHAAAPSPEGPWSEHEPAVLKGIEGIHVSAPGVIHDPADGCFHMAMQEDFTSIGGRIQYLVSCDGHEFVHVATILEPMPHSGEAGLYDPHFCIVGGHKYLAYAGMPAEIPHGRPFIPQPDVYVAQSETGLWVGPWKRLGKALGHDDISWHHNRLDHPDYEWGIEGPQIVELPDRRILLNATCFLETGRRGTRQRVFFALADSIDGPYRTLGPALSEMRAEWESGENGHATAVVIDGKIYLFYQARPADPGAARRGWGYGLAVFDLRDLA